MTSIHIPKETIAQNFQAIAAGDCIFRCHQTQFSGTDFNIRSSSDGRFTPLMSPGGKVIPTLYAAESFDAAVYETILRQESSTESIMPISTIDNISVSRILVRRELMMVKLFTPELRRWNIDESELISSLVDSYAACRVLVARIWRDNPSVCGLVWRSRQDSESNAYLLFGDRCDDGDLLVQQTQTRNSDIQFPRQIIKAARRAGIRME